MNKHLKNINKSIIVNEAQIDNKMEIARKISRYEEYYEKIQYISHCISSGR